MYDLKLVIVGAIVVDHTDRIFMHLRDDKQTISHPGHWSLFGGRVELGESEVQGIQRELFEELATQAEEHEFKLFRIIDIPEKRYYIYHVNVGKRGDAAVLGEGQAFERFTRQELAKKLEVGKIGERPIIPWVKETVLQFINS